MGGPGQVRKQDFRKCAGGEGTRRRWLSGDVGLRRAGAPLSGESTGVGLFTCRPGGAGGRAATSLGRLLAGNVLSSTPHMNMGAGFLFCALSDVRLLISGRKKCVCVC